MASLARETARETLYVAGLDTSLPKSQLREALFYRFSRYGQVVDVVCMKRQRRLRGQAWVVFRQVCQVCPGGAANNHECNGHYDIGWWKHGCVHRVRGWIRNIHRY